MATHELSTLFPGLLLLRFASVRMCLPLVYHLFGCILLGICQRTSAADTATDRSVSLKLYSKAIVVD